MILLLYYLISGCHRGGFGVEGGIFNAGAKCAVEAGAP